MGNAKPCRLAAQIPNHKDCCSCTTVAMGVERLLREEHEERGGGLFLVCFHCCDKDHGQEQLRKKGFGLADTSRQQSALRGGKAGTEAGTTEEC